MATASVTYSNFINGTASDADQIDQNFADVVAFLNTEVVHVDGSKSMTDFLNLKSADPTDANHAVRKSYADLQRATTQHTYALAAGATAAAGANIATLTITDPGYDIEVSGLGAALVSPTSTLDLANVWQLGIRTTPAALTPFTTIGALVIPVVSSIQQLITPCPWVTYTTGTYGGTLNLFLTMERFGGTQNTITIAANDARYNYFEVSYRKKF